MEEFYPSEIARLVLGYLKDVNCSHSWERFLKESYDLREYYRLYKEEKVYSTNVNGKSLLDILEEYCAYKSKAVFKNDQGKTSKNDSHTYEIHRTPYNISENACAKVTINQGVQTCNLFQTLTPETPKRKSKCRVTQLNFDHETESVNKNISNGSINEDEPSSSLCSNPVLNATCNNDIAIPTICYSNSDIAVKSKLLNKSVQTACNNNIAVKSKVLSKSIQTEFSYLNHQNVFDKCVQTENVCQALPDLPKYSEETIDQLTSTSESKTESVSNSVARPAINTEIKNTFDTPDLTPVGSTLVSNKQNSPITETCDHAEEPSSGLNNSSLLSVTELQNFEPETSLQGRPRSTSLKEPVDAERFSKVERSPEKINVLPSESLVLKYAQQTRTSDASDTLENMEVTIQDTVNDDLTSSRKDPAFEKYHGSNKSSGSNFTSEINFSKLNTEKFAANGNETFTAVECGIQPDETDENIDLANEISDPFKITMKGAMDTIGESNSNSQEIIKPVGSSHELSIASANTISECDTVSYLTDEICDGPSQSKTLKESSSYLNSVGSASNPCQSNVNSACSDIENHPESTFDLISKKSSIEEAEKSGLGNCTQSKDIAGSEMNQPALLDSTQNAPDKSHVRNNIESASNNSGSISASSHVVKQPNSIVQPVNAVFSTFQLPSISSTNLIKNNNTRYKYIMVVPLQTAPAAVSLNPLVVAPPPVTVVPENERLTFTNNIHSKNIENTATILGSTGTHIASVTNSPRKQKKSVSPEVHIPTKKSTGTHIASVTNSPRKQKKSVSPEVHIPTKKSTGTHIASVTNSPRKQKKSVSPEVHIPTKKKTETQGASFTSSQQTCKQKKSVSFEVPTPTKKSPKPSKRKYDEKELSVYESLVKQCKKDYSRNRKRQPDCSSPSSSTEEISPIKKMDKCAVLPHFKSSTSSYESSVPKTHSKDSDEMKIESEGRVLKVLVSDVFKSAHAKFLDYSNHNKNNPHFSNRNENNEHSSDQDENNEYQNDNFDDLSAQNRRSLRPRQSKYKNLCRSKSSNSIDVNHKKVLKNSLPNLVSSTCKRKRGRPRKINNLESSTDVSIALDNIETTTQLASVVEDYNSELYDTELNSVGRESTDTLVSNIRSAFENFPDLPENIEVIILDNTDDDTVDNEEYVCLEANNEYLADSEGAHQSKYSTENIKTSEISSLVSSNKNVSLEVIADGHCKSTISASGDSDPVKCNSENVSDNLEQKNMPLQSDKEVMSEDINIEEREDFDSSNKNVSFEVIADDHCKNIISVSGDSYSVKCNSENVSDSLEQNDMPLQSGKEVMSEDVNIEEREDLNSSNKNASLEVIPDNHCKNRISVSKHSDSVKCNSENVSDNLEQHDMSLQSGKEVMSEDVNIEERGDLDSSNKNVSLELIADDHCKNRISASGDSDSVKCNSENVSENLEQNDMPLQSDKEVMSDDINIEEREDLDSSNKNVSLEIIADDHCKNTISASGDSDPVKCNSENVSDNLEQNDMPLQSDKEVMSEDINIEEREDLDSSNKNAPLEVIADDHCKNRISASKHSDSVKCNSENVSDNLEQHDMPLQSGKEVISEDISIEERGDLDSNNKNVSLELIADNNCKNTISASENSDSVKCNSENVSDNMEQNDIPLQSDKEVMSEDSNMEEREDLDSSRTLLINTSPFIERYNFENSDDYLDHEMTKSSDSSNHINDSLDINTNVETTEDPNYIFSPTDIAVPHISSHDKEPKSSSINKECVLQDSSVIVDSEKNVELTSCIQNLNVNSNVCVSMSNEIEKHFQRDSSAKGINCHLPTGILNSIKHWNFIAQQSKLRTERLNSSKPIFINPFLSNDKDTSYNMKTSGVLQPSSNSNFGSNFTAKIVNLSTKENSVTNNNNLKVSNTSATLQKSTTVTEKYVHNLDQNENILLHDKKEETISSDISKKSEEHESLGNAKEEITVINISSENSFSKTNSNNKNVPFKKRLRHLSYDSLKQNYADFQPSLCNQFMIRSKSTTCLKKEGMLYNETDTNINKDSSTLSKYSSYESGLHALNGQLKEFDANSVAVHSFSSSPVHLFNTAPMLGSSDISSYTTDKFSAKNQFLDENSPSPIKSKEVGPDKLSPKRLLFEEHSQSPTEIQQMAPKGLILGEESQSPTNGQMSANKLPSKRLLLEENSQSPIKVAAKHLLLEENSRSSSKVQISANESPVKIPVLGEDLQSPTKIQQMVANKLSAKRFLLEEDSQSPAKVQIDSTDVEDIGNGAEQDNQNKYEITFKNNIPKTYDADFEMRESINGSLKEVLCKETNAPLESVSRSVFEKKISKENGNLSCSIVGSKRKSSQHLPNTCSVLVHSHVKSTPTEQNDCLGSDLFSTDNSHSIAKRQKFNNLPSSTMVIQPISSEIGENFTSPHNQNLSQCELHVQNVSYESLHLYNSDIAQNIQANISEDSPVRYISNIKRVIHKSALRKKTEKDPNIPSGVKIPSKWNTSKIKNYSHAIGHSICDETKESNLTVKKKRRSRPTLKISSIKSPVKKNISTNVLNSPQKLCSESCLRESSTSKNTLCNWVSKEKIPKRILKGKTVKKCTKASNKKNFKSLKEKGNFQLNNDFFVPTSISTKDAVKTYTETFDHCETTQDIVEADIGRSNEEGSELYNAIASCEKELLKSQSGNISEYPTDEMKCDLSMEEKSNSAYDNYQKETTGEENLFQLANKNAKYNALLDKIKSIGVDKVLDLLEARK